MALELNDLVQSARESRVDFIKLLDGLSDEQWTWKPYPECKSIRETVIHMIGNDRLAKQSIENPALEIDWAGHATAMAQEFAGTTSEDLIPILKEGQGTTLSTLLTIAEGLSLDAPLSLFGGHPRKLGVVAAGLTSEDFYHSGQVAFIRMATDPNWDYYAAMYGF